jgi:4-amino-4-deoxy-L-arabinose transferase-like glycosyltransferase
MLSKKILLNYLPIILIIILASFLRLIWLDKIPNAIGGDEIVYVLNSKALFLTGHDIFGSWNPIQGLMFIYPKGEAQAELPYILDSLIVGVLPFSLFAAHLTNAILAVLLAVVIYLVAKELFGKEAGIIAGLIAGINPWLIYIGRTAYEATPAMLFYLIAFYILLKAKSWKILFAFPFLVLAFYSYIATKLILLPFVFAIIIYCYFLNKKKYLKQYLILFSLCILFVLFYLVSLKLNPSTARLGELLTPNSPGIADTVNYIRSTSIENPLTNFFTNKYSVFVDIVIVKTIKTFASDYLFISADQFFSIYRHGLFYYIDSLFMVLGALFLFSKKRIIFLLISSLGLIGVIPQVLHTASTDNFSIHATMMYPFLIMFIAFGIWETINLFKKRNYRLFSAAIILLIYFASLANFFNIYAYWFPLRGYFDFSLRTVSTYSVRASSNQKVTIYSDAAYDYFKKFLFYSNGYNKDTAEIIKNNLNKKIYSIGNVTVTPCDFPKNYKNKNNLIIMDVKCGDEPIPLPHLTIAALSDAGQTFKVYNDKICNGVGFNRYPSNLKLSDFNMESLSNKYFCKTFITSQ